MMNFQAKCLGSGNSKYDTPVSVLELLECNSVASPNKLSLVAEVKMRKPSGSSQIRVDLPN